MHRVRALCLCLLLSAAGFCACVGWVTAAATECVSLLCAGPSVHSDGAVVEAVGDGLQQVLLFAVAGVV